MSTLYQPPSQGCYLLNKQTNSVTFSPQANYIDWSTATCRQILVPTFVDRGVSHSQRGGTPTAVNLSLPDRSRQCFFQVAPYLSLRGWVDLVPDPLLLRKSGSAENLTRDFWVCSQEVWTLDHRGGPVFSDMLLIMSQNSDTGIYSSGR
jgi:hypothetical protein